MCPTRSRPPARPSTGAAIFSEEALRLFPPQSGQRQSLGMSSQRVPGTVLVGRGPGVGSSHAGRPTCGDCVRKRCGCWRLEFGERGYAGSLAEAAIRFCEALFGREYASLMSRAVDNALTSEPPRKPSRAG